MPSEITDKLLAGRIFMNVSEFPMFELTLSPVFDCNEWNSENEFRISKSVLDAWNYNLVK